MGSHSCGENDQWSRHSAFINEMSPNKEMFLSGLFFSSKSRTKHNRALKNTGGVTVPICNEGKNTWYYRGKTAVAEEEQAQT